MTFTCAIVRGTKVHKPVKRIAKLEMKRLIHRHQCPPSFSGARWLFVKALGQHSRWRKANAIVVLWGSVARSVAITDFLLAACDCESVLVPQSARRYAIDHLGCRPRCWTGTRPGRYAWPGSRRWSWCSRRRGCRRSSSRRSCRGCRSGCHGRSRSCRRGCGRSRRRCRRVARSGRRRAGRHLKCITLCYRHRNRSCRERPCRCSIGACLSLFVSAAACINHRASVAIVTMQALVAFEHRQPTRSCYSFHP